MIRNIYISVFLLASFLLPGFLMTSCEEEQVGVSEILFTNIKSGKKTMTVGEEFEIKYAVLPVELEQTAEIAWESSDKKVAKVRRGKITAEGPGEAIITASCGKAKASVLINVNAVQITSLDFPSDIEVFEGTTVKVNFANITPAEGSLTTVEWEIETYDDGDADYELSDGDLYITGTKEGMADLVGYISGKLAGRCEIVVKKRVPVETVTVTLSKTSIEFDQSLTFSTSVKPSNASVKDVNVTCTPADYVIISGNTITAKQKAGKVTVFAVADGVTGSAEFEIVSPPLTLTIAGEGFGDGNGYNFLSPDSSVGDFPTSARLVLSANYGGVDFSKVVWKSSNQNIVEVDSDGKVTGVGHGTAVITAEVDGIKATYTVRSVKKSSFGITLVNYYKKTPLSSISTPKNIYLVEYYDPAFASDRSAFDYGLYGHYRLTLNPSSGLTAHLEGDTAVIRAESPSSGSVSFSLDNGKSVSLPVTMKVQSLTFIGVDTGKNYGTVQKGGSFKIVHKDMDPRPGLGTFEAIRVFCNVGTSYDESVSEDVGMYTWRSDIVSTDPFDYGTIQWNNPKNGTHVITMTDFDPTFSITLTIESENI